MSDTTKTTAWAVKRINYYYGGTFHARQDDYLRTDYDQGPNDGKILAVADKAAAERIAEHAAPRGTYYLAHGEYERPDFEPRRVKLDPARVRLVDEAEACRLLGLDYDLEVA